MNPPVEFEQGMLDVRMPRRQCDGNEGGNCTNMKIPQMEAFQDMIFDLLRLYTGHLKFGISFSLSVRLLYDIAGLWYFMRKRFMKFWYGLVCYGMAWCGMNDKMKYDGRR